MYAGKPGYRVDKFYPEQMAGGALGEYFYKNDHHPYEATGHRLAGGWLTPVIYCRSALTGGAVALGDAAHVILHMARGCTGL